MFAHQILIIIMNWGGQISSRISIASLLLAQTVSLSRSFCVAGQTEWGRFRLIERPHSPSPGEREFCETALATFHGISTAAICDGPYAHRCPFIARLHEHILLFRFSSALRSCPIQSRRGPKFLYRARHTFISLECVK